MQPPAAAANGDLSSLLEGGGGVPTGSAGMVMRIGQKRLVVVVLPPATDGAIMAPEPTPVFLLLVSSGPQSTTGRLVAPTTLVDRAHPGGWDDILNDLENRGEFLLQQVDPIGRYGLYEQGCSVEKLRNETYKMVVVVLVVDMIR
eukprot:scaffold20626_cov73-Cylindrotheca_fusiformis.AAC.2